jgi:tetratricopeptide (TPR) repeat protein
VRLGWFQHSVIGQMPAPPAWLGSLQALAGVIALSLLLLTLAARRRRRRRRIEGRAARLRGETQALKEQLRSSLVAPDGLLFDGISADPIMGVNTAFESDLEAAVETVLAEAGGRRPKAKELLRQRLNGHAIADGRGRGGQNGSGVAYWRQLGALSLLDNAADAATAYARAADLAPDDPQAQMLAGVLHLRAGNLPAAEAAFRRQIKLSSAEGGGLSRYRGHTMLGDVHAARYAHAEALAAYAEAQREVLALLDREPAQAWLRRDLSVTFDRIGDTLASQGELDDALANYRQTLEIVAALAAPEPGNVVWIRDLSVSHDRIGDTLDRKGDPEGALQSYLQGLHFAQALAARDPNNTQWQWDLSASHDRIGDMQLAKGQTEAALQSYRRGLAIAEALVARDPSNIGWRRDLAVSYHKTGSLEAMRHNPGEARDLLEKGRAIIARLARIASYQTQWRSDLAKFDRALQGLDG